MQNSKVDHTFGKDAIEELKELFNSIDIDKNGTISKKEFSDALISSSAGVSKSAIDFCLNVADT